MYANLKNWTAGKKVISSVSYFLYWWHREVREFLKNLQKFLGILVHTKKFFIFLFLRARVIKNCIGNVQGNSFCSKDGFLSSLYPCLGFCNLIGLKGRYVQRFFSTNLDFWASICSANSFEQLSDEIGSKKSFVRSFTVNFF